MNVDMMPLPNHTGSTVSKTSCSQETCYIARRRAKIVKRHEQVVRDMQFSGSGEQPIHDTGDLMCVGECSGALAGSGVCALPEATCCSP